MTAHVSPDAPRPPSGIRDSGGPMPFNEADFTRTAAELVAEGDKVPKQRAWRKGQLTAEDIAAIERLHEMHPRETCDLFATTTGRCTCDVPAASERTSP